MKFFSLQINSDGTTSVSHDEATWKAWKAKKAAAKLPIVAKQSRGPCPDLGMHIGTTTGCLCGNRGVEIDVFWCKRFGVECTQDPTAVVSARRVCKRCPAGPWADI